MSYRTIKVFPVILASVVLIAAAGKAKKSNSAPESDAATQESFPAEFKPYPPEAEATPELVPMSARVVVPGPSATAVTTPRPTPVPLTTGQLDAMIFPQGFNANDKDALSIMYSGFRRSQLEPCGCVSHQLGGIDKEGRVIQRLGELKQPMVKVDAGGFMKDKPSDVAIMMTRYMLGAVNDMKYDAVNVSYQDLGAGLKFLRQEETTPSLPFVSANILDAAGQPIFKPYRVALAELRNGDAVQVGIIGVTRPRAMPKTPTATPVTSPTQVSQGADCIDWNTLVAEGPDDIARGMGSDNPETAGAETYTIADPAAALNKYIPELRKQCDIVVLLDFEKREEVPNLLKKLEAGVTVDFAVAGEFTQPTAKVLEANGVKIVTTGFEGRQLGHLAVKFKDRKAGKFGNQMVEILQSIVPDPAITKFITDFRNAVKPAPPEPPKGSSSAVTTASISGLSHSTYSSQLACASCHKKETDQWESTKHAHAFASLITKGQQLNPECVKCHVTGYGEESGFKDFRVTEQLANVQCESCHGPGNQHVIDKRIAEIRRNSPSQGPAMATAAPPLRKSFDAAFCMNCHDSANDPRFDFARDIKFVDHKVFAQRPAGSGLSQPTTATMPQASM